VPRDDFRQRLGALVLAAGLVAAAAIAALKGAWWIGVALLAVWAALELWPALRRRLRKERS